jgi:predicted acyltransferase
MTGTHRLLSLDVFRGITVAGMILVNNPGSWSHIYPPLGHAEWNGWTPTDLVFPFFLFIVGVAITYSLGGKVASGISRLAIIKSILRRSATLFLLGLFLAAFPFFQLSTIRIPGVLQRIGVCFLFASIIYLFTSVRGQAIAAAALAALYWILMKAVPVPGSYVAAVIERGGSLEKEANLAAYLDNMLLGGHLWSQSKTWDPEGILSTIPAVATVLFGILAGHWIRSRRGHKEKTAGLLLTGAAGVFIGLVFDLWFPINKNLWSSSYVIFSAGMAMLFLAICYWLVDYKHYRRPFFPFAVYGTNAITVFVLSGIVAKMMAFKIARADGSHISLQSYYYTNYFASWAGPINGSLAYAVAFIALMFIPAYFLYRHRIFIKV